MDDLSNTELPPHVAHKPELIAIWKRSRHILPEINFQERFARTVLLPIRGRVVQEQVALLRDAIANEPGSTMKRAWELSGLRKNRASALLNMREGIEWRSVRRDKSTTRNFYPNPEGSCAHLPNEVTVEYLVAELERTGTKFWVEGDARRHWFWWTAEYPDISAWISALGDAVLEYVKLRDGFSSGNRPQSFKFLHDSRAKRKIQKPGD